MKSIFNILIFFMFMIISEQSLALRCGHKLIDEGFSKLKVLSLCGEPDFQEIREILYPSYCRDRSYYHSPYYSRRYRKYNDSYRRYTPNYTVCHYRTSEVWVYNFGPRKFMRELVFRKGVVKEINTLEYGF